MQIEAVQTSISLSNTPKGRADKFRVNIIQGLKVSLSTRSTEDSIHICKYRFKTLHLVLYTLAHLYIRLHVRRAYIIV